MKKRIGAALLALLLCVSALTDAARAEDPFEGYIDLDPDAWYAQGVRFCMENGLMNGTGRRFKHFDPYQPMTRAQLAVTLWRMEGEPVTGLTMQYNDVKETAWYADAVRWAQAADVMGGYTILEFAPGDSVTREQLAAILWRYAQYRNGSAPTPDDPEFETYIDLDQVSDYALDAMRWANALGIITGTKTWRGKNMLTPRAESTRAVTATILMRFCLDMGIFDIEVETGA